jgi:hypothetical protein
MTATEIADLEEIQRGNAGRKEYEEPDLRQRDS